MRADHVLDSPVVALRKHARAEAWPCAEPLPLFTSVVKEGRNFRQDFLRRNLYAFSCSKRKATQHDSARRMPAMKPIDTVRKIYRDFAAGDAAAILAVFADDIEFRLAESHPYRGSAGAWRGKQAITESFFAVAGPEWDGWSVGVEQTSRPPMPSSSKGGTRACTSPRGGAMDVQVCHVWRFKGARVSSFHQYVDTASLRRVMGRDAASG